MKPILFNTDMVRAILDGRKTVTRRLVKPAPRKKSCTSMFNPATQQLVFYERLGVGVWKAPYKIGDILYVRETWKVYEASSAGCCTIEYKAGGKEKFNKILALPTAKGDWKPSIHMPKEAARIFLRVKDVRVEHLQDITDEQAKSEGIRGFFIGMGESGYAVSAETNTFYDGPVGAFANLWNSTIPQSERDTYGWDANPWVWVIEFERISMEEAMKDANSCI